MMGYINWKHFLLENSKTYDVRDTCFLVCIKIKSLRTSIARIAMEAGRRWPGKEISYMERGESIRMGEMLKSLS